MVARLTRDCSRFSIRFPGGIPRGKEGGNFFHSVHLPRVSGRNGNSEPRKRQQLLTRRLQRFTGPKSDQPYSVAVSVQSENAGPIG